MLVNASFYFVLLGTLVIAAGQPFLINCPAKIAAFWFKKENVYFMVISEAFCHFASHGY
jgi:hypothetical protein